MSGPVKVDVLVVGSGAAGLSAAVTAAMHGASVMVAEKASVLGGTSAPVRRLAVDPRNPLARAEGIDEAADAPLTYLQHEMGAKPPIFVCKPSCVTGRRWWNFSISGRRCSFSRAAPCRTFTRRRVRRTVGGRSPRNPTMAACSATGSIACVRRWRPLASGGMGIAGGADMAHFFNATRSPRSALYAARRLLRHGWQRLRAGRGQHLVNGNALVARLLRSALDAGVRFQLNAPVVRLLQGPPGVSGASAAQRRRGDSRRSWRRGAGLRRFSPRSPAAGAGGASRCGGLRPFLRRTAGQSGRGDQAWRIRRRPVRHFPAPPAGLGRRCPASLWPAASS